MRETVNSEWSVVRRRWGLVATAAMILLAVLSPVRFSTHPRSFEFEVTTSTVIFVALAFVPWLMERVLDRGGSLRLPGGLEVVLDARGLREIGLPGLDATRTEVHSRLRRLEEEYERWRSVAQTWHRTQNLERVLAEARLLAGAASEQIGARLDGFESASDGSRAITLGLIEGAIAVPGKTGSTLVGGLSSPRSSFEEYHLLTAVDLHHRHFSAPERRSIRDHVSEKLNGGAWPAGSDRRRVARIIVEAGTG